MDGFLTQKKCDRCGADLKDGRTMSMFNEDCICKDCKNREMDDKDYKKAQDKEIEQVRKGDLNYKGIRNEEWNIINIWG